MSEQAQVMRTHSAANRAFTFGQIAISALVVQWLGTAVGIDIAGIILTALLVGWWVAVIGAVVVLVGGFGWAIASGFIDGRTPERRRQRDQQEALDRAYFWGQVS